MRRRDFITLLGSGAAWPVAARAQQTALPVIGFLSPASNDPGMVTAFGKGLGETGFIEGRNVAIEYRWANNDAARLPGLAADLVRRRVDVMIVTNSTPAILAAKNATSTIPVIFSSGADPVQAGFVASLNRPGGNLTGVSTLNIELEPKRLGLLRELLPRARRIGLLVNPTNPNTESVIRDVKASASAVGFEIEVLTASSNRDIDTAFAGSAQRRPDGLLVSPNALFLNRRVQLAILAARQAIPAIYSYRENVEVGGLMSYGTPSTDLHQVGIYAGRILKGEKPADLPVIQATKFELVVNLQTAKTLGIDIPHTLLAIADEVIE
jgi:putative ABC transport system substrate-binding protein